ncbi:MAG TPA: Ig-like domain-containing protein, partial [Bacteriovoracaceae bacterium]|nr:Ig-like domain-containing protein [Bacteriovoracaceae bacterium]
TVTGACSEATRNVVVSVGGVGSTVACGAGLTYTTTYDVTTAADSATLSITANHTDAAGNNATQATQSVVKDTSNPTVTITTSTTINLANETSYTVSGACSEAGQNVVVSVGGVGSTVTCSAGTLVYTTTYNVSAATDSLTLSITANHSDSNGNPATQATQSVIMDTIAPTVTITTSTTINLANETSYTVSGACSEATRNVVISVGGVGSTVACSAGTLLYTTSYNVSAATDSLTLSITANHTDAAGNPATQATQSVVMDTIAPTITITSSTTINNANRTAYTVTGACSEATRNVVISVGGQPSTVACAAGTLDYTTTFDVTGASDSLTLSITANHSDAAGNPATQATQSVIKDTSNPTVTITTSTTINLANETSYTVSGACSEAGRNVVVSVGGVGSTVTCSAGTLLYTTTFNVSAATDSLTLSITANHSDSNGNPATQATQSVIMDTIAPTVTITSSTTINNANKAAYTVTGACSEATRNVVISVGGVGSTVSCAAGTLVYTTTYNVTGASDSLTLSITANHTDAAGNSATQATQSVVKDTSNPTVAITSSPVINKNNKTAYPVSGTCSEATRTVTVVVGGVSSTPVCTGGNTWSATPDVSAVADGAAIAITANHTDAALNNATQASTTVLKDTTDQRAVGFNFTEGTAIPEDTQRVITLLYTDADADLATSCAIVGTNMFESQACACNASGVCTVGVTGSLNYNGAASFTYTVTSFGLSSLPKTVTTSISAVNDAPVLSAITAQTTARGVATGAIAFTYNDVDSPTACTSARLTMTSSLTGVVANGSVTWGGTAPNCTATITPVAGQIGSPTITITATDSAGATGTTSFILTVQGVVFQITTVANADLTTIDFGRTVPGTPNTTAAGATVTIRVQNIGNITSSAVGIVYGGGDLANFITQTTDCTTITAASFCTLTIVYGQNGPPGEKVANVTASATGASDVCTLTARK